MEETVNQGTNTQATEGAATEQKTFTQEEMNKIVSERVQRERAKYEDYDSLKAKAAKFDEQEEANKTELQKATERAEKLEAEVKSLKKASEVKNIRNKVAEEFGIPSSLLLGETEDDCKAQAKALLEWKDPGYPSVKDGGEVKVSSKKTTADQFADWMKKQTK